MSCIFGENRDIYFPKLDQGLHLITFSEIAEKFLEQKGFVPLLVNSEVEARASINEIIRDGKWPCLFTESNTTGEKSFEEFFTDKEVLDIEKHHNLGVVKNTPEFNEGKLMYFLDTISELREKRSWNKQEIVKLFHEMIPNFGHKEVGIYLDSKM